MRSQASAILRRVFLARHDATYALGLADASQPVKPTIPVRLAVRSAGVVYEARPKERLHAQLVVRLKLREWEDGWTVSEADLPAEVLAALYAAAERLEREEAANG